jgi:DNA repair exonuclease SbcCD nuclease subunit
MIHNKVAIFSDIHLGVHQNSDFWLTIANRWADWYVSNLKQQDIKDIIFCGDFFHYRDEISVKTLNFAKDLLSKFDDFNITMITGNHDAWYKDSSEINSLSILKGLKNLTIYDKITCQTVNDRVLAFCPWGTKVNDVPPCDIIFGHFELENFKMNGYKICDHGDNPETLIAKAPLVITGHFHLRDEKVFPGNRKIIYVGNPFEMDFGDSQQTKGFYVLDLKDLTYSFTENNITPRHIRVNLSKLIIDPDPIKFFNTVIAGNIIKLIIDCNINVDHLDLLIAKLSSFKPCEIRVDYDVNYNKVKLVDDAEFDLSGVNMIDAITEFINLLDIENKPEVTRYTLDLLTRSADRP